MIHFEYKRALQQEISAMLRISLTTIALLFFLNIFLLFNLKNNSIIIFYCILIIASAIGLFIVLKLLFRHQQLSKEQNQEWHIQLTDTNLSWFVPVHHFGEEKSFDISLQNIKCIERQRILGYDTMHQVDYFLHLKSNETIQLRGFSGIELDKLCLELKELGVEFDEKDV